MLGFYNFNGYFFIIIPQAIKKESQFFKIL
jgi:hypothetical protein